MLKLAENNSTFCNGCYSLPHGTVTLPISGSGVVARAAGPGRRGGGVVLGLGFAGYVPLVSQNPHPIIVYSVASYRPHPIHFWANVIVISKT